MVKKICVISILLSSTLHGACLKLPRKEQKNSWWQWLTEIKSKQPVIDTNPATMPPNYVRIEINHVFNAIPDHYNSSMQEAARNRQQPEETFSEQFARRALTIYQAREKEQKTINNVFLRAIVTDTLNELKKKID